MAAAGTMEGSGVLPLALLALAAALVAVWLKDSRLPVLSLLVTLAAGVLILLRLMPSLGQLWRQMAALGLSTGVEPAYLTLVLKVIALAYVAEFSAQLCRDAGQGALALKVELGGKLAILALAFPLVSAVVRSVLSLLD